MSVKIIMRYYSLFFRALPLTKNCFGQKATLCALIRRNVCFSRRNVRLQILTDFTDMLKCTRKTRGTHFEIRQKL